MFLVGEGGCDHEFDLSFGDSAHHLLFFIYGWIGTWVPVACLEVVVGGARLGHRRNGVVVGGVVRNLACAFKDELWIALHGHVATLANLAAMCVELVPLAVPGQLLLVLTLDDIEGLIDELASTSFNGVALLMTGLVAVGVDAISLAARGGFHEIVTCRQFPLEGSLLTGDAVVFIYLSLLALLQVALLYRLLLGLLDEGSLEGPVESKSVVPFWLHHLIMTWCPILG